MSPPASRLMRQDPLDVGELLVHPIHVGAADRAVPGLKIAGGRLHLTYREVQPGRFPSRQRAILHRAVDAVVQGGGPVLEIFAVGLRRRLRVAGGRQKEERYQ